MKKRYIGILVLILLAGTAYVVFRFSENEDAACTLDCESICNETYELDKLGDQSCECDCLQFIEPNFGMPDGGDQPYGNEWVYECPVETMPFLDHNTGVSFCYPKSTRVVINDNFYLIQSLEGETLRELAFYDDLREPADEFILDKYSNASARDDGYVCDLLEISNPYGSLFLITGDDGSGASLEAVTVCRENDVLANSLSELPAEYFFIPKIFDGRYIVVNGEQDRLLSDYTQIFESSISLAP